MLIPLLMRADRRGYEVQVAYFAPGETQAAVARQGGVPVHELELSRRRFAPGAAGELLGVVRRFRPDIIHAWGHSAQCATVLLRKFCNWNPAVIWNTAATSDRAGLIARGKLRLLRMTATLPRQIVYASSVLASHYRHLEFPEACAVIPFGLDTERHKPDFAARKRVREQLKLEPQDFVIGMNAPFLPEHDHATFIRATGELIKFNPHIQVLLAGRGIQRGNAALMALLGGGTLASRATLLGEWSDASALFNACDVVCSSALNDTAAPMIATAMLCGVPCVATGRGAQGEVLGQYGIAVESGNAGSFVKAIARLAEMPAEKRAHMAHAARQHALRNYSVQGAIDKYHALYARLTEPSAPAPATSLQVDQSN